MRRCLLLQKAGVKWAMAGRNKQKLENIRQSLCKIDASVKVRDMRVQ